VSGSERLGAATRHDVIVVGDGPAGSALSAALVDADVDVALLGLDAPWTATYGTWVDEVPSQVDLGVLAARTPIDAVGARRHVLPREYAVFDNARLRTALRRAPHRITTVVSALATNDGVRLVTDERDVWLARVVIDATGAAPALVGQRPGGGGRRDRSGIAWQTAYGLVLDERPAGLEGEHGVLMDWRSPGISFHDEATFVYAVPIGDGRWLVEETSLARRVPMPPGELRLRLAARLGRDLTDRAEYVEHVRIPMAGGVPERHQRLVGFGAAARYLHPATGYSVAASLRAAPRVAAEVAAALGVGSSPSELSLRSWNAVWPSSARRSRALHDYGLAALLRMRPDELRRFFDGFFELSVADWSEYLRIDASPLAVSRVMAGVFSSAPWSLRRRLALGNPLPLRRALRPRAPLRTSSPNDAPPAPNPRARTR